MHNQRTTNECPDFNGLVREYLRLDPSVLIVMDPMKVSAVAGLHELLRRTLERALGSLWPEGLKFRLSADASTNALRAAGWPDVKTYNLSLLLAHALLSKARRVRGRSYIPLCPADASVIELPREPSVHERMPTAGLVAMAIELFEIGACTSGLGALQPISICKLAQDMLGMSPEELVRPCYTGSYDAAEALSRDPDGHASFGLAVLFMSVLDTYQRIVDKSDVDAIKLLIVDHGQEGQKDARRSNVINLLVAGLLADGERDVALLI